MAGAKKSCVKPKASVAMASAGIWPAAGSAAKYWLAGKPPDMPAPARAARTSASCA